MCQNSVKIMGFRVRNIITHFADFSQQKAFSRTGFQEEFNKPLELQSFGFFTT